MLIQIIKIASNSLDCQPWVEAAQPGKGEEHILSSDTFIRHRLCGQEAWRRKSSPGIYSRAEKAGHLVSQIQGIDASHPGVTVPFQGHLAMLGDIC